MDTQILTYQTTFVDGNGSGLIVSKPDNTSSLENVKHKFTRVSIAGGTTDGTIVSAVSGKKIRVMKFEVICAAAGASFIALNTKPAGAGTAIYGAMDLVASEKVPRDFDLFGYCETNVGEGLSGTTGANAVKIMVGYIEIG